MSNYSDCLFLVYDAPRYDSVYRPAIDCVESRNVNAVRAMVSDLRSDLTGVKEIDVGFAKYFDSHNMGNGETFEVFLKRMCSVVDYILVRFLERYEGGIADDADVDQFLRFYLGKTCNLYYPQYWMVDDPLIVYSEEYIEYVRKRSGAFDHALDPYNDFQSFNPVDPNGKYDYAWIPVKVSPAQAAQILSELNGETDAVAGVSANKDYADEAAYLTKGLRRTSDGTAYFLIVHLDL